MKAQLRDLLLVAASMAFGAILVLILSWALQKLPADPPYFTTTQEQLDYQYKLNHSADRVSSMLPSINADDGRLYLAVDMSNQLNECTSASCAVAVEREGGYEVKLPVGHTYRLDGGDLGLASYDDRYTAQPIVSLTYWDPVAHEPRTLTSQDGKSVEAPEVLQYRQVRDLKEGQYGFIDIRDVVELDDGRIEVVSFADLAYEPGDASFNTSEDVVVPITLQKNGVIAVCLDRSPALYLPDIALEEDGLDAELKDC